MQIYFLNMLPFLDWQCGIDRISFVLSWILTFMCCKTKLLGQSTIGIAISDTKNRAVFNGYDIAKMMCIALIYRRSAPLKFILYSLNIAFEFAVLECIAHLILKNWNVHLQDSCFKYYKGLHCTKIKSISRVVYYLFSHLRLVY